MKVSDEISGKALQPGILHLHAILMEKPHFSGKDTESEGETRKRSMCHHMGRSMAGAWQAQEGLSHLYPKFTWFQVTKIHTEKEVIAHDSVRADGELSNLGLRFCGKSLWIPQLRAWFSSRICSRNSVSFSTVV